MARKPVGDSQVANRSRILGVLVFYSGVIGTGGMRISWFWADFCIREKLSV